MTGLDPRNKTNQVSSIISSAKSTSGIDVTVTNSSGTVLAGSALAGTGSIVRQMSGGTVVNQYVIILRGDSNGDGLINTSDLTAQFKHVMNRKLLSGPYSTAADANRDGKVNTSDLNAIFKHVMARSTLTQ